MKRARHVVLAGLLFGALIMAPACSHLQTDNRYPSKMQVLALEDCPKLEALKRFESGVFKQGFVREIVRESSPVPFELYETFLVGNPRLVLFMKSDFEEIPNRGSEPYRESVNRYRVVGCEEPAGKLYLILVRHDPQTGEQFVGARMSQALESTGCKITPVAAPRAIGFYQDSTEDDILRHVRRGKCRDYALNR